MGVQVSHLEIEFCLSWVSLLIYLKSVIAVINFFWVLISQFTIGCYLDVFVYFLKWLKSW